LFCENVFTTVPPDAEIHIYNIMFNPRKVLNLLIIITSVVLLSGGCSKDDNSYNNTSFTLIKKDVFGISGTVTFTETSNNSTIIDVTLNGAPSGTHPVNLYNSTTIEDSIVYKSLNSIDGSGKSSTIVDIPYGKLISYDGCIKILKSDSEPTVILAQGDIGGNVITSTYKTYNLITIPAYGVTGTAKFEKRANGTTLVTIALVDFIVGPADYFATINLGSIETVDELTIRKTLNNINGTTGKSYTNIKFLDSKIPITYDKWLVYLGYINIYQTAILPANVISHGNIGSN